MRARRVAGLLAVVFLLSVAGQVVTGPASAGTLAKAARPGAPTAVTASAVSNGAQLSWDAPATDGGAPITGYMITAWPGGQTANTTDVTSFTVGGLTNGTSYRFSVAAINSTGAGRIGRSPSVRPHAPKVPPAPSAVTATSSYQSVTVLWSAPPAQPGGAPVSGYTITASPGKITVPAEADATQAVVTGLKDGTAYKIKVAATDSAGTGPAAAAAGPVTPAVTSPGQPATVQASAGDNGTVNVQWTPPASNGGSPVTGYSVTTSPGSATIAVDAGTTSAAVSGLTSGTSYTVSVSAVNSHGTGPAATSGAVSPDAAVTAATVVLDASSLAALTAVHTDGSLTFNGAPAQVTGLADGAVIAAGVSATTPDGLLRQVTGVTTTSSTTTVATSPAALDQALTSGDLATEGTLAYGDVASFAPARAGVRLDRQPEGARARPAATVTAGGALSVSADFDLYKSGDDRTVHISGTASINPKISLSVGLSGGHLHTDYKATITQSSSLTFKAELTHKFGASIPLGSISFEPISFTIGIVPVVIVPELSLSLNADGTITVGATTSASQSNTYGVELTGTDGAVTASPISEHTTAYTPPTLYDSLSVQAGPEARLALLLYGIPGGGPYLQDSLTLLKLDASTTANPWWTLRAENVVSAGFELSVLGHKLVDWRDDSLSDAVLPLADAGGPFMGVVITPSAASVSPGQSLQLSAAVQRSTLQAVTWSVPSGDGTITSAGLYTAPASPGTYRATATSAASGLKPLTQGILDIRVGDQLPDPPVGVAAASTDIGTAGITWAAPPNTGGAAITGYTVTASPGGEAQTAPGAATGATMTGLAGGTAYTFTVTATNTAGTSQPSSPTDPVVIDDTHGPSGGQPSGPVTVTGFAGNGTAEFSGDGGPAASAGLDSPEGLATDRNGDVYIFDTRNFRIREVDPAGNISTLAGGAVCTGTGVSDAPGPDNSGICPTGVMGGSDGDLMIASLGLDDVHPDGTLYHVAGKVDGNYWPVDGDPFGVSVNPDTLAASGSSAYFGEVTNSDQPSVNSLKLWDGSRISTVAGISDNGNCSGYASNGDAALGACIHPAALAVRGHYIYFFDSSEQRGPVIFRIDLSQTTRSLTKIAGSGSWNESGDDGPAVDAGISDAGPIAVSSSGAVYFGNGLSGEIREVDPSGVMRQVVNLASPAASLAFGPAGNLYASLPQGNLVVRVSGLPS